MGRESELNPRVREFGKGQIPAGPAIVRDAYGRGLAEGDHIQLPPWPAQIFTVKTITPVMDPNLPAGLLDVTLACVVKFRAVRNQMNPEFIRVLTALETAGASHATAARAEGERLENQAVEPGGVAEATDEEGKDRS